MNREFESRLLTFCVAQRRRFEAAAWKRFSAFGPLELPATLRYLASVNWYGHQRELCDVADQLSRSRFQNWRAKWGLIQVGSPVY